MFRWYDTLIREIVRKMILLYAFMWYTNVILRYQLSYETLMYGLVRIKYLYVCNSPHAHCIRESRFPVVILMSSLVYVVFLYKNICMSLYRLYIYNFDAFCGGAINVVQDALLFGMTIKLSVDSLTTISCETVNLAMPINCARM